MSFDQPTKGPDFTGLAYHIKYDLHIQGLEQQLADILDGRPGLYHSANQMIEDLWQEGASIIEAFSKTVAHYEKELPWVS